MTAANLVSFLGIFVFAFVAWLLSSNRRVVNWRVVVVGIGLQLLIAFFVFLVPAGTRLMMFLNDAVVKLLAAAQAGIQFLFGRLAIGPGQTGPAGETSLGYILVVQGLFTIIYFAALMALLYHWRVLPFIVRLFARAFSSTMRISGAEALSVSSNIFVGVESSLVVKPHLAHMTVSELGTILTAGMATVASTVFAVYVAALKPVFPMIAGHLVSASLIAAPAAVVMAKLMMPETGAPRTLGQKVQPFYDREPNAISSVITGAGDGLRLLGGIVSLLAAFLGLLALGDMILGWAGGGLNRLFGWHVAWSFKTILGWIFTPFTFLLGVPGPEIGPVAGLIGERTVATELVAYQHLADLIRQGVIATPRAAIIASYALCGFAHIASVAIFVGGTAALAPSRTKDLAKIGFRCLIAATLACLMTAAVAGTFYTGGSVLFGR